MTKERTIRPVCPGCRRKIKAVPEHLRGKKGRCPACRTVFIVDEVCRMVKQGADARPESPPASSCSTAPEQRIPPSQEEGLAEATRLAGTPQSVPDPEATTIAAPPGQVADPQATRVATPSKPDQEADAAPPAVPAQPQADPEATRMSPPPQADPEATRLAASPSPEADSDATRAAPGPVPEAEPDATQIADPEADADTTRLVPGQEAALGTYADCPEDDVPLSWKSGDLLLNTYLVDKVLGQGAFGTVYKVRHQEWGLDLAVKTPNPEALDAHGAEIFTSEAETWSELGLHPHIVSCYYVRNMGGAPRAFAEFVDGGSLQELIESGGVADIEKKLDIAIQFAWGLAYAHAQNLVHQDVKPANLMLTADGRAKVTDFGLTRAKGAQGSGQELDIGGGRTVLVDGSGCTPAYAAPEQLAGGQVSRAAEAWSFGVSILAMFTGGARWRVGPAAPVVLDELPPETTPLPEKLAALLREFFIVEPENRLRDMNQVASRLMEVYREETGNEYPRMPPRLDQALAADSLNNRALSQLDLGRSEHAAALFQEALILQPHHPEATYNLGLMRWRAGVISDMDLVAELEEVRHTHTATWTDELALGLVHMERGDYAAAMEVLESIDDESGKESTQVVEALEKSRELAPQSREEHVEWGQWQQKHPQYCAVDDKSSIAIICFADKPFAEVFAMPSGALLQTLDGHASNVLAVALNQDGSMAATGSADMTVKVWDLQDSTCLKTLGKQNPNPRNVYQGVKALRFARGGDVVLAGGLFGPVQEWDVSNGGELRLFKHEGLRSAPVAMDLDRHENVLVVGHADGNIALWDYASGKFLRRFKVFQEGLTALRCTPDGRTIIAGGDRGMLRLVDPATGKARREHKVYQYGLNCIERHSHAGLAATGNSNASLKLWDLAQGRCLCTYETVGQNSLVKRNIFGLSLVDDGKAVHELHVAAGKTLCTRRVYLPSHAPWLLCRISDSETVNEALQVFEAELQQAREAVAAGSCSKALAHLHTARSQPGCERESGAMALANELAMRLPRRRLVGGWQALSIQAHSKMITALACSPDGSFFVSGADYNFHTRDCALKAWRMEDGECQAAFEGVQKRTHAVAVSPDAQCVVSSHMGASVRVWEAGSGKLLQEFESAPLEAQKLAVTPDGRLVVGAWCAMANKTTPSLLIWELASGRLLRVVEAHKNFLWAMGLSMDATRVATYGANEMLSVWELASGIPVHAFTPEAVRPKYLAFTPGGGALLGAGGGALFRLDAGQGDVLEQARGAGDTDPQCAVTTDCTHVFISRDRLIEAWTAQDMACQRRFEGHQERVWAVAVSPKGDRLLSGDGNGVIRHWHLDWELEPRDLAEWDDGAMPYLQDFIIRQNLRVGSLPADRKPTEEELCAYLTPAGVPGWSEEDFQQLVFTLQCAGYGWLRPEGVRRKLHDMAGTKHEAQTPPQASLTAPQPQAEPKATRLAPPPQEAPFDPETMRVPSPQHTKPTQDATPEVMVPQAEPDPEATRLATPAQADPEATRTAASPQSAQDPEATRLAAAAPKLEHDPEATRMEAPQQDSPDAPHVGARQPVTAGSLNNLAFSQLDQGNREQAEELLRKALELKPSHPEATYNLGLLRWRAGEITDRDLVYELEQILESRPADWRTALLLSQVHMERGDVLQAHAVLREVAEMVPEVREALEKLPPEAQYQTTELVCEPVYYPGFYLPAEEQERVPVAADRTLLVDNEGQYLLLVDFTDARDWDEQREAASRIAAIPPWQAEIKAMALAPDASYAALFHADGLLRVFDIRNRRLYKEYADAMQHRNDQYKEFRVKHLVFSSDCRRILLSDGKAVVLVFDIHANTLQTVLPAGGVSFRSITYDTHLNWIVATLPRVGDPVLVVNVSTGATARHDLSLMQSCKVVEVDPDGSYYVLDFSQKTLHHVGSGPNGPISLRSIPVPYVSDVMVYLSQKRTQLFTQRSSTCLLLRNDGGVAASLELADFASPGYSLRVREKANGDLEIMESWWPSIAMNTRGRTLAPSRPAPFAKCSAADGKAAASLFNDFEKALESARKAYGQGDYPAAQGHLNQARANAEYNQHPEALALWRRLSHHLVRRGLTAFWKSTHPMEKKIPNGAVLIDGGERFQALPMDDGETLVFDMRTKNSFLFTGYKHSHVYGASHFALCHPWGVLGNLKTFVRFSDGRVIREIDPELKPQSVYGHSQRCPVIAMYCNDNAIRLWDAACGRIVAQHKLPTRVHHRYMGAIGCMDLDGRFLKFEQSLDPAQDCKLNEICPGFFLMGCLPKGFTPIRYFQRPQGDILMFGVVFDVDGYHLVRYFPDKSISEALPLQGSDRNASNSPKVVLSQDGRLLSGNLLDGKLNIWCVETGSLLLTHKLVESGPLLLDRVIFSRDSNSLFYPEMKKLVALTLDWELAAPEPADLDTAQPLLLSFLQRHTPRAGTIPLGRDLTDEDNAAITRPSPPACWGAMELLSLQAELGLYGYGHWSLDTLKQKLRQLAPASQPSPFHEVLESLEETPHAGLLAGHDLVQAMTPVDFFYDFGIHGEEVLLAVLQPGTDSKTDFSPPLCILTNRMIRVIDAGGEPRSFQFPFLKQLKLKENNGITALHVNKEPVLSMDKSDVPACSRFLQLSTAVHKIVMQSRYSS